MATKISKQTYAKRIRESELNPQDVINAFDAYKEWAVINYRKPPKSQDRFLKSWSFPRFMAFIKFAQKINLPDISSFMQVMKKYDIGVQSWTRDFAYRRYLEYVDNQEDPMISIERMVLFMAHEAEKDSMDVRTFVIHMHIGNVILFLQQRKFTPWIILNSKVFSTKILDADEIFQRQFADLIDMHTWKIKMHENSNALLFSLEIISEFDL